MDATNIAWLTFITASALWWAITNGLISYYQERQNEISQLYFRSCVNSLKADLREELLKEEFLESLQLSRLQLVTVPDVVTGLKVFRAQSIGMLGSSVALLFMIIVFKVMAEVGMMEETEMRRLAFWLSLFSITLTFLVAGWIILTPIRLEVRYAFSEVSQWRNIRASTS